MSSSDPRVPSGAPTTDGETPDLAPRDLPATDLPPPDLPPPHVDAADAEADGPTLPRGTALVAVAFREELMAQEALLACMRLQKHGRLQLDDAVIAIKVDEKKVRLVQTKDVNAPQGAVSGSWWGLLAGLFVGGPLIGAALGAAVGGIWAKMRDIGIKDDEMREMGESLRPGEAALFLLVTDGHPSHALFEAQRFHGRLLATTLDEGLAERLREALSGGANPWDG